MRAKTEPRIAVALTTLLLVVTSACGASAARTVAPGRPPAATPRARVTPRPPIDTTIREDADGALVAPPSPALNDALAAYAEGDFHRAAPMLLTVVEGQTDAAPNEVQAAQHFVGKTFVHLGLLISALGVFDEILQTRDHPFRARTALWLSRIALERPLRASTLSRVTQLSVAEVERAADGAGELGEHLRLLRGRAAYVEGEHEVAITLLRSVPSTSRWAYEARMIEGAAQVRTRHARAAMEVFRRAIEALDSEPSSPETTARRDLAWLAVGRLYYSAAGGDERRLPLLADAVAALDRVAPTGRDADDARFVRAWALFRLDRADGTRTALDALSPAFVERTPEVTTLRAVVLRGQCDLEGSERTLRALEPALTPRIEALSSFVETLRDGRDAALLVQQIDRDGAAPSIPESIVTLVPALLRDPVLADRVALLARLDAEDGTMRDAPIAFASSVVGMRVLQDIAVWRSLAADDIGDLVRMRAARWIDEARDEMAYARALADEIAAARRGGAACTPWL